MKTLSADYKYGFGGKLPPPSPHGSVRKYFKIPSHSASLWDFFRELLDVKCSACQTHLANMQQTYNYIDLFMN